MSKRKNTLGHIGGIVGEDLNTYGLSGITGETVRNASQFPPVSGRITGENGEVVNIVDLLGGGRPIGKATLNITQFVPRSGRIVGEDGSVYELVQLLKKVSEGSTAKGVIDINGIADNGIIGMAAEV